ncbi:protein Shroom1 [Oxyura jamaicensis]|uniref:protein Shroom1 n=1 Tax=Oxyura jamaicensis TaxID=8884 RepID=UPI0015A5D1BC|nr:protein Shroom1 [Oxyura jamaicensis]XP_035194247.1 protein Shroom1 [Oxyura jamaicensis]XP_035194248.1 protein Shroom1 [Oxyura jamaicensis]XP_035194249.1 protein Shroom1 [Oxyura jamaicensis]
MALSGNEIERWTPGQGGRIGELVEPAASPDGSRLSPVTSLGSADQLLHLPGRADSAYSSFSGGSNVPEYPTPSCYGEHCSLPPEQVPYMDSEYVRGIYNLSAANSGLRWLQPHKAPDPGIRGAPHSAGLAGGFGSTPSPGAPSQGPPPPAAPPPSPPVRLDSFRVARHLENTRGRRHLGSLSEGSAQPADVSWSQNRDEIPEPDAAAAGRKTVEHKGWWSAGPADGVSVSKGPGLRTVENAERSPAQKPVKRSNPHVFSRPSSFIFQEYLRTDSVATVSKIFSAYNSAHAHQIPVEMNSRPCRPGHANPRPVNDTQEDKQYPCSVRRPSFREADLRSTVPEPSQWRGSLLCAQCPLRAELRSEPGRDVFEDICDFKYMEHALTKNASRKLNSCTDEIWCYNYKGELGSGAGELLLNPQANTQKPSVSCSHHAAEPADADQAALLRPKEDSTSQFLNEARKEKQANNSSAELSVHLEQEEAPAPYQKYQPELQEQLSRELWDDLAGEQISRQTTPMLYYLSGGKATNILHHHKLAQCQEGSRSSPEEFPTSSHAPSVRSGEEQRESGQRQPASQHHQRAAAGLNETGGVVLGSPASSMDESFKNDYREKLKVAQKKVLRETSFKRKDLQMSLPVRLRQKPSKRPSIEHLRSFSLSGAHEEAKLAPCSPSHLESLESFNRDGEIKRPQRGQTGGRKRETKEEKKLCYSEPEKLDQLADKEVPWNQVRGERTEPGTEAARRKTLENRGRALSSSGISRTELKQIQHTALVEYMERKISQRPGGTQLVPLHKPPLQKRPSLPQWPPGKASNPNGSRKMHSDEVFCQVFSEEPPPDVFLPPSVVSRCSPGSAAAGPVPSEPSPCPAAGGSRGSEQAPAESLPGAGAPAAAPAAQRPESTPPAAQEAEGCASGASGAVSPSQPLESCLGTPSFCDRVGGGCQNHEQDNDTTEHSCQDAEELPPETSTPSPRRGTKEDAQVEKECQAGSPNGSALTKRPEQQLKASDAAVPQEKGTCCHTSLAQSHQGDKNAPRGLFAKEAAVLNSQEDIWQERETNQSKRRLWSAEDQRYEELAMEIVAKDRSLVDILMPCPVRKTALDLMEGLFPVDVSMLDKSHRRKADVQHVQGNDRKSNGDVPEECSEPELNAKQRSDSPTCKGSQAPNRSGDDTKDLDDITCKKLELISSLRSKLRALGEDRELVLSEASECAARGKELEATVRDVCKPNEFERYLMFIGDLEKVVSLLLCLSSRLARVQNAMRKIDGNTDAEEKQSLNERHKLLSRQREDAKDLKENLDRRGRVVSGILTKYLTEQQLQDYRRFVQEKTSLLIEQKDLEEQIKFFEEQLENLEKSVPL